jgi:hypothetical protein
MRVASDFAIIKSRLRIRMRLKTKPRTRGLAALILRGF